MLISDMDQAIYPVSHHSSKKDHKYLHKKPYNINMIITSLIVKKYLSKIKTSRMIMEDNSVHLPHRAQ